MAMTREGSERRWALTMALDRRDVSSPQTDPVPVEIPARFLVDINKLILESTWRAAGHRRAETVLKTKSVGGRMADI